MKRSLLYSKVSVERGVVTLGVWPMMVVTAPNFEGFIFAHFHSK